MCDVAVALLQLLPRDVLPAGNVVDSGDTRENDRAIARAPSRLGRGKSIAARTQ